MIWLLLVFALVCSVAIYVGTVRMPRTPLVSTSRNQTVINNGELIVTSSDAGSVSVRSTEDTIVVTYTRKRRS